ncbi:MAG: PEP/pyruvate-binding domain-containing protein [Dissulfurispiraceae bacterium]
MKLFQQVFGISKKSKAETDADKEKRKEALQQRFLAFQRLLAANNHVLESMADMEEKLSGEFLFDRRYLDSSVNAITVSVKDIIDNLNQIAHNKYVVLTDRHQCINSEILGILTKKGEIPVSDYTIPFEDVTRDNADKVGSKCANLGEIRNRIAIPVPDGFAISAFAFKGFMEYNGFREKVQQRLAALSVDNIETLNDTSKEIQDLIREAEVPPDLAKEVSDSYGRLCDKCQCEIMVSVRSSALQEDGEFSFAGQYSTFLNVPFGSLLQRYKDVVASLFNQRALFYYKTKGFDDFDMVMPVGVLAMVDAKAGGVMYSTDPNDPKKNAVIISAVRGLGLCVVDGTVTPETYEVSRSPGMKIVDRKLSTQLAMLVCKVEGEIAEAVIDASASGKPSLTDEEIQILARYALMLESHFEGPQDIEWAIDRNDRPYILQSRPLRITVKEAAKPLPTRIKGHTILIERGTIACKGVGFGKAYIVRTDEDLKNFPEGAVLVARHTSTKFVTVMKKASAIITDVGAITGHMASLSREFQVPTILDAETATAVIKNGQEITVDAINCNIYEGLVQELIEYADKKEEPFKETHIFKMLERVLKWVVPLGLIDPASETFRAESCQTYHDITRFCHEMGMRELFSVTETSASDVGAVKLVAGIPMEIYLLDLGEGIEDTQKHLTPEHLRSVPFIAFLKGLKSMRWPEGQPLDAKGFLGMMAHSASIPEEELLKTAEKSFCFVSKNYMNFAIRLGYHLSTVEAFAGENINDNYVKFFFKGGGAVMERRLRRVRLITEILKCLDFNVTVIDDVVEASLMKYKKETIERKLEAMGKFTVYTKQLDMVMYNDAITDHYIEEFCNTHITEKG